MKTTILLLAMFMMSQVVYAKENTYNNSQSRDLYRILALNPDIVTEKEAAVLSSASSDGKKVYATQTDILHMTTDRTTITCSRKTERVNGEVKSRRFKCTTET